MSRHNNTVNSDGTRVVEFPVVETVQSQAARWLAVLDSEEPSPEKIEEFKAWLNQNETHGKEFESMLAFWDELNVLTEAMPPRKTADRHGRAARPGAGSRFWPGVLACLVLVVAAVLITVTVPPPVYITEVGEQKTIQLEDGTSVLLNTDSRIAIDYDARLRRVTLHQGEALFQIAHEPDRPFEVHAGDGIIRALGTVFTVYMGDDNIEVLVTEGVVEIEKNRPARQQEADAKKASEAESGDDPADGLERVPARVLAGTRAVFGLEEFSEVELAAVDQSRIETRLAWQHGVLAFDQEPLEAVVKEMARYTSLRFVIPDKTLREMKVGGIFKLGDTDSMSEALYQGFGIRSNRVSADLVYLVVADNH